MPASLRHAFRRLVKTPAFTITALATLAICLAANLTIFAVVNAILVRPLPFPDAGRLVAVVNSYPGAGYPHGGASLPNYFDRRHALPALSSLALVSEDNAIIGDPGSPQRVPSARITPEFFFTLDVPLALGRSFTEAELNYGADQVAILTDGFWRAHFHADAAVLGKTFRIDDTPVTVVGILPPGFHYLSGRAQFYRPLSSGADQRGPRNRHNSTGEMIARLAPHATLAEAQAQIDALNARLAADDPWASSLKQWDYHTFVRSLHEDHVASIKPTLLLLQAGAALLLLIGIVNLANLLLIRTSGRTKELAVRQALGAGAWHLVREGLSEIILLALAGGTLGLLLGAFGIDLVARFGAGQLPLDTPVSLDSGIAVGGFIATVICGAALSLPVIWFSLRTKLAPGLQIESHGGTASRSAQRLRHGFIVVQVAFAFVLLSGAALLGLSLERVLATPSGFNAAHVLTGEITLPWKRYPTEAAGRTFVQRVLADVRALPGVTDVAINNSLPFTGRVSGVPFVTEAHASTGGQSLRAEHRAGVTSGYFAATGIPLVRGRLLEDDDGQRSPTVCVIDQTIANRYWPGLDPVGRRLAFDTAFHAGKAATIVGVVGNVKQNDLGETSDFGMVYYPYAKFQTNFFYLVVRSSLPPAVLAPSIRKAILQIDPELPIDDLRPLQSRIDDSLAARRSPALLAGIFAGVALLLAGLGLYGVMAYTVAQRTREFGIRLALGAPRGNVLRLVLRQGAFLAALGLAAGLALALPLGGALSSLLYGVSPDDALTLGVVALLVGIVASLACVLPAQRATNVNPIYALRAE